MGINTIKFDNKRNVKLVAHRGLSGIERENTCPAFIAAAVKNYYGIETDVHVTKDKKYIIAHDDDLKRIANLDIVIRECEYSELRKIRLTDIDGKTQRADLFLPSLEEYLSICKKYSKIAVLELKEQMSEEDVKGIAAAVENMEMSENTTFISFCPDNLLFLRKHYPKSNAQFLSSNISAETVKFILENKLDADIFGGAVNKDFVDLMHSHKRLVNVWTIDKLEQAQLLSDCGVDMITSNILE